MLFLATWEFLRIPLPKKSNLAKVQATTMVYVYYFRQRVLMFASFSLS
jgi:hypothetical protein